MDLQAKVGALVAEFPGVIAEAPKFRGETTVVLSDPSRSQEVCRFAKATLGFDYLVDLSSIDYYGDDPRFELVYELYSYADNHSLRLKTKISEESSRAPSVTSVWRTANWHEREVYDMMGITFEGHPDLKRILMWEGYPYFPLRKDFPVVGKETELPEVAFTRAAPLEGGPFVTSPGVTGAEAREPRSRAAEEEDFGQ